ncbi:Oidioi.mRNA.OKI2018_I69.chr2.g7027.t1.cds [Oikopleura dioica]|uniref:U6 snRNA-associated Sm-like protein LSm8 n=1 Tax=Oikopleura dioica TaxID=34765 RepID=A0ABN7T9N7_OIKDI|nr:Oidioi.mRNA.OKI2018_I69.chr2.g7027.t1.cds [Oikopleura dioica]
MSAMLDALVGNKVEIVTNDGRVVVGILKGLDQVVNVVLANTEERVFTPEGVDRQALGLYLIRGDNVAVIGAVDENTELGMDFSTIKAQQLPPIVHD